MFLLDSDGRSAVSLKLQDLSLSIVILILFKLP